MATAMDRKLWAQWQREIEKRRRRPQPATTVSGVPIDPLYTPDNLDGFDYETALGYPGQYPFTRGVHATMYRGRLWTMRQFAGFGTARQTNERFKFLVDKGQTGLSTAFDLPTLMGLDSDDPRSLGEVGRLGVAVDTIDDMRQLFDGIDLGKLSVSMTINAPAVVIMAFYLATAQDRGFDWRKLRGTIQNDILKEFHAQNEIVFPPEPSVRLAIDVIEFCTQHVPQWNPVSISGYHIREAGSTAAQELAFTLADGFHYVEECLARGLAVDDFAPRLSFFFNAHNDLFEEVAKYRAARVAVGRPAAEPLRRDERELVEAALPRPDGRLLAAGQAAGGEPDPRGLPGAGRRAGRLPVAAHQQHGRDAGAALGTRRDAGPAHAAGAGARDGRDQHGRPAGRQLLRRDADAADAAGRPALLRPHRGAGRHDRRPSIAASSAARSPRPRSPTSARSTPSRSSSSASTPIRRRTRSRSRSSRSTTPSRPSRSRRWRKSKRERSADDVRRTLDAVRRAAEARQNLLPALLDAARARATVGEVMNALADVFGRCDSAVV